MVKISIVLTIKCFKYSDEFQVLVRTGKPLKTLFHFAIIQSHVIPIGAARLSSKGRNASAEGEKLCWGGGGSRISCILEF